MTLRLLTYLAPSLPAALFEMLADHLAAALGCDVELRYDHARSGPRPGEQEAFRRSDVDIAFMCATSYVWLTGDQEPAGRLVGAAWAPSDPRAQGRARYYGDVLAAPGGPAALADLAGARVAYNDDVSLSGYHSLRLALAKAAVDTDRVTFVRSGSHLRSLELLTGGEVDAAAVDSNVWRRRRREDPALLGGLREIAELGPHPVQPVVARAGIPADVTDAVRTALLGAHEAPGVARALAGAELARFVPVADTDFAELRSELAALALDGAPP